MEQKAYYHLPGLFEFYDLYTPVTVSGAAGASGSGKKKKKKYLPW